MTKQLLIPVFLASLLSTGEIVLAAEKSHEHGSVHAPASKSIAATGTVKSVDSAAGKLVIDHDPIPALNWPRMVMDFRLADQALAEKVKAGDKVKFEMKAGDKGAYVIMAIEPTP